jgi:trehalose/maltose hydrolase-like predicted phosphorylase
LKDLGYDLPADYLEKNLEYYLARTSHGSTLSRVVHAQLAEMIGNRKLSWKLYADALSSDFNDIQGGTTAEGIHAGVMAGTLMIAFSTFAGIDTRREILSVLPALPEQWKKMSLKMHFRGTKYHFLISHDNIVVSTNKDAILRINNLEQKLTENKPLSINY